MYSLYIYINIYIYIYIQAARNGHIALCKWLVFEKYIDVNIQTDDLTCALHFAAYNNQVETCVWLIEEGKCDINILNSFGCNASQWLSINGNVQLMNYFKSKGLNFHIINKNGHSALHKAAIKGNIDAIKWLLSSDGGNLGPLHMYPDDDGFTPYLFAKNNGHASLAELLERGE